MNIYTYLNPVVIRISNESNSVDATLSGPFMKFDAQRLETLACLFEIIYKDRSMTKASAHIVFIAIVVSKIRLILSTPIAFYELASLTSFSLYSNLLKQLNDTAVRECQSELLFLSFRNSIHKG